MSFRLTAPKLQLSENDVEAQCITLLGLHGYKAVRQQSGLFKTPDGRWVRVGEPGLPDYTAMHGKRLSFFLEVKRPGEKRSPEQERKHTELRIQGQIVVTVDSVQGLKDWLELHGRSP